MIKRYSELNIEQVAKSKGYNFGPVYHGTKNMSFNVFDVDLKGTNTFHKKDEVGFHFTTDKKDAEVFSGGRLKQNYPKAGIKTVFLRINNPLVLTHSAVNTKHILEAIEKEKDGIIAPTGLGYDNKELVVFTPTQIKLADPITYDDSGKPIPLSERFNPNNPDIRY